MKRNTRSATFRIENKNFELLSSEAEGKRISLNTLVNQILHEHVEWHAHARKAGLIPFSKGLVTSLMSKFTDEEIIQLASDSTKYPKETVLFLKREYNVANALNVLESWLMVAGFPYVVDGKNNEYKIAVQHDMGKKWSLFLAELIRLVYVSLGAKIQTDITDNTLMMRLSSS